MILFSQRSGREISGLYLLKLAERREQDFLREVLAIAQRDPQARQPAPYERGGLLTREARKRALSRVDHLGPGVEVLSYTSPVPGTDGRLPPEAGHARRTGGRTAARGRPEAGMPQNPRENGAPGRSGAIRISNEIIEYNSCGEWIVPHPGCGSRRRRGGAGTHRLAGDSGCARARLEAGCRPPPRGSSA